MIPLIFNWYTYANTKSSALRDEWKSPLLIHVPPFHCWTILICRCTSLAAVTLLVACAKSYVQPSGDDHAFPKLTESYALIEDGYVPPLTRWQAADSTQAVLLSLHELNDDSQQAIIDQRLDAFWKSHDALYTFSEFNGSY